MDGFSNDKTWSVGTSTWWLSDPLYVVGLKGPMDDRFETCAHQWNWHFTHPRIIHHANWTLAIYYVRTHVCSLFKDAIIFVYLSSSLEIPTDIGKPIACVNWRCCLNVICNIKCQSSRVEILSIYFSYFPLCILVVVQGLVNTYQLVTCNISLWSWSFMPVTGETKRNFLTENILL